MFPVGVSSGYGLQLHMQSLVEMKESGIDYIELSLGKGFEPDYEQMVKAANSANVGIWTAHLPYRPMDQLDISLEDPEVRAKGLDFLSRLIARIADLGVDKFVLHPSTPLPENCNRTERKKCAMDTLNKLAEAAHRYGAVIAVEDMTRPCLGNSAEELRELISVNDKLRVNFDMNHLFNNTHEEFAKLLGDKIISVHISDYDMAEERHWLPGEGSLDWPRITRLLWDIGYRGVWMYELSFTGRKMAERGRPLTFQDLRRNADEIFAGKNPSVITL